MNNSIKVLAALLSITSASMFVVAGDHVHNSNSSYSWSDDDHSLALHSQGRNGVLVDKARPAPLHGLQAGDVIVSISGHSIAQLDDLLQVVHRARGCPATIQLRRGAETVTANWTHADCATMFPPPPLPPAPPKAPAPPVPPAGN